LNIKDQNACIG